MHPAGHHPTGGAPILSSEGFDQHHPLAFLVPPGGDHPVAGQVEQNRRSIAPVRIVAHMLVVLSPTGLSSQTPMLDLGHEPLPQAAHHAQRRRAWDLVCWDLQRHDWRTFRLDRMSALLRTGARTQRRPLPVEDPTEMVLATDTETDTYPYEAVVHLDLPLQEMRQVFGVWATGAAPNPGGG